jgi:hypothetical protein
MIRRGGYVGLLAAGSWTSGLSVRVGWVYLVTEEADGEVLEFVPARDPLLTRRQAELIGAMPTPLLLYVSRLAGAFRRAGRQLRSVKAISCYQLNGQRPARQLYVATTNLLEYCNAFWGGAASFSEPLQLSSLWQGAAQLLLSDRQASTVFWAGIGGRLGVKLCSIF